MAGTDWAVLVPSTITALAVPAVTVVLARMSRKVSAIDRAVNGQPIGTEHMVDNVQGIKAEQKRVAAELVVTETTRRVDAEQIAADLDATHTRAEAVDSDDAGAAADAAMRRDDIE